MWATLLTRLRQAFLILRGKNPYAVETEGVFQLLTDGKMLKDGKIKLEMDWNDKFIENAKSSGCGGVKDKEIVEQYLGILLCAILGLSPTEQDEMLKETRNSEIIK